ncbi:MULTISPECIES: DUF6894 family protein [Bradyrhizobium]|uniref:DUF6894 family protein n=1 Tax=Bradyrhizobium TaxID=374 RepID=UPI00293EE496|nr:hypothetical protein [Bradyrhizobium sp. BWC-3-1]WOH56103.1 hypothetical protein RX329_28040 [Bradyrhizobium sp. BWC-3-1]
MTRFFFHVHNGISVFDDVGLELPDIEAAEAAAIELFGEILNDGPDGPLWQKNTWRVEVSDGPGIRRVGRLDPELQPTTAVGLIAARVIEN